MIFRRTVFAVFVSLLLVRSSAAPASDESPVRLHWLGLKQVSADTNAAAFLKVWQLPPTTALVAQTLGKLSRWPGHGVTNAASTAIRPLLDDLITSEFYLELNSSLSAGGEGRGEVGSHPSLLLAVRLPADRARLWQTNLAAAAAAWAAAGTPHRMEISRAGDWTLVGVGLDKKISKTDFAARLPRPQHSAATNLWLETDFTPSLLANFFSLSARRTGGEGQGEVGQPSSLSAGGEGRGEVGIFSTINHQLSTINSVHLTVSGSAGYAVTRGTIDFSAPFATALPAWQIPTNLIHAPLTSLTAVRGFAPWLASLPVWQQLSLTSVPDQAFFWAQKINNPFPTYCAVPLPGASNQLSQLAGRLVQNVNPWLATNGTGNFQWQTNLPGIVWDDTFILAPLLKPATANGQDYLLGGLIPFIEGNTNPPPADVLHEVLGTDHLVYYHTEVTGQRVEDDFFILQFLRVAFHKPQLPAKAAGTQWLKNVEPLLGNSVTVGIQSGPQQLAFTRYSTTGLTALELHLLADWLESPQFPHGLHTFLVPPDKQ